MTNLGELLVTEDVWQIVDEQLKYKNIDIVFSLEVPDDWIDRTSYDETPYYGEARILDEMENVIGKVTWEMRYEIEADGDYKWIEGSIEECTVSIELDNEDLMEQLLEEY